MTFVPNTQHSLILRLRDHADSVAWRRFVELYEPVIYRVARRYGFQDADALEATQVVLISVAKAVQDWDPTGRAPFRSWLLRIVRNKLIDHFRRSPRAAIGPGGTSVQRRMQQTPDPADGLSAIIDEDYRRELRRELLHRAACEVQEHVQPSTWEAFWQTTIGGKRISDVARELGISVGAVHIARSRVLARLRQHVEDQQRRSAIDSSEGILRTEKQS